MTAGSPGGDELEPPAAGRRRATSPARARALGEADPVGARHEGDAAGAYLHSLLRAQLLLGVACALAFALALGAIPVLVVVVPALDGARLGGFPLSWLLLAFGTTPLAVLTGVVYLRQAGRNERRYRALVETDAA